MASMYNTSYIKAYGENERTRRAFNASDTRANYVNNAVTQKQAPMTLEMQGYPPHGPGRMASTATMPSPNPMMGSTQAPNSQMQFTIRKYSLPELSPMPKTKFRPLGTRVVAQRPKHAFTLQPDPGYARSQPELKMNGEMMSQYRCYSDDQYQSAAQYGKESISRRLAPKERRRYQIPGYMGFVPQQQFNHGQSYGKTTRACCFYEA